MTFMKRTSQILAASLMVLFFLSCWGSQKQQKNIAAENKPAPTPVVEKQPIIDAHVHALKAWKPEWGQWPWPEWQPPNFLPAPATDEDLRRETFEMFKRYHIVKAVASGGALDQWRAAAPDLVVPAYQTLIAGTTPEDFAALRKGLAAGRWAVIGEVGSQYARMTPSDPRFEPFFALAEELDKPMTVHMGLGAPGNAEFRMSLGDPLLFEEALARHPKLRLCVCHAAWPFLDRMIALLYYYPQVYVDTAFIDWYLPQKEFQMYLHRLVEAGYGKRIMFGSDNMYWPESIRLAVESIESADFLTPEQKRDIFYNNAVRFFRLE